MSACLWNDIDAYLVTAITADMGTGSSYTTHRIESIVVGEQYDPDQAIYPHMLIRGLATDYSQAENHHTMGGAYHWRGIRYPYELIATTTAPDVDSAKQAAQELARRTREVIRTRTALGGLQSTDGEIVQNIRPDRAFTQVIGHSGAGGAYLAIAFFSVAFITHTA